MDPWIRALLSIGVASVACYAILFRPEDAAARQWAASAIGMVLGYWLRDAEQSRKRA